MCEHDLLDATSDGDQFPDPLLVAAAMLHEKRYEEASEILTPLLLPLIMEDLAAEQPQSDDGKEDAI